MAHVFAIHCERTMRMQIGRMAVAAAMGVLIAGAQAGEPAGVVKSVTGEARLERGTTILPVEAGLAVEQSDRIVVTRTGRVGITLKDDTLLAIGPGSNIVVETFSFNQTTYAGDLAVRVASGTMRMITGLIAKQSPASVKISTPNAVIGTRGTDFIVEVPAND